MITKIARFKQNTLETSFGAVSIKDIQPIVDPTRVQSARRRPNVDLTICVICEYARDMKASMIDGAFVNSKFLCFPAFVSVANAILIYLYNQ